MTGGGLDSLKVDSMEDLLPEDERKKLHDDLKKLADLRRRVEVECRNLPMA